MKIKAPFRYFGGKSAVADEVWRRLGTGADAPKHYIEPFAGSLAVLLTRPPPVDGQVFIETVNDLDGLLVNVWRAIAHAPDDVRRHASWPVSEIDLHARRDWLLSRRSEITTNLSDPEWFDAKAAGWWIWGASLWIGSGWGSSTSRQMPQLAHRRQMGVSTKSLDMIDLVSNRLRGVRALCGDWKRALSRSLTGSPTRARGLWPVAVFIDTPYPKGVEYAVGGDAQSISDEAWTWATNMAESDDSIRIAVCGYEDGRHVPDGWSTYRWSTSNRERGSGYGNQAIDGQGRHNGKQEVIWFSPGCLPVR